MCPECRKWILRAQSKNFKVFASVVGWGGGERGGGGLQPAKSLAPYPPPQKLVSGFEGRIWNFIELVPGHSLSFYFDNTVDSRYLEVEGTL